MFKHIPCMLVNDNKGKLTDCKERDLYFFKTLLYSSVTDSKLHIFLMCNSFLNFICFKRGREGEGGEEKYDV